MADVPTLRGAVATLIGAATETSRGQTLTAVAATSSTSGSRLLLLTGSTGLSRIVAGSSPTSDRPETSRIETPDGAPRLPSGEGETGSS